MAGTKKYDIFELVEIWKEKEKRIKNKLEGYASMTLRATKTTKKEGNKKEGK